MPRPAEYENLIRTRAREAVQATPGAVAGFLKNAESFFALSKSLLAGAPLATEPMQIFTNAYEGYHQVVQAVLEFYEVRTKEAARAMAIQRVSADLKPSNPTMVAILEKYLPAARSLTGLPA